MKCPWREETHFRKDYGETTRSVTWHSCYKEECPFYWTDNRRKKANWCSRIFGGCEE